MSEHHELCQLRIDGLKDTIATLTAQLEKAHNEGRSWMEYADELKDTVMAAEAEIATLTAQRDAAVTEADSLRDAIDHPYTSGVITRAEIAESRADAAEKVCEALPGRFLFSTITDPPSWSVANRLKRAEDALTEWRRTKEGS